MDSGIPQRGIISGRIRSQIMMTKEERQAEIKRLQEDNKEALSTPLMSEGSISPMQVGMMSPRQKAKWQALAQTRLKIEAQIRLLNLTDQQIQESEEWEANKKRESRILQIDSLVSMMERFKGKNGKTLPKYQKEINKLEAEKLSLNR